MFHFVMFFFNFACSLLLLLDFHPVFSRSFFPGRTSFLIFFGFDILNIFGELLISLPFHVINYKISNWSSSIDVNSSSCIMLALILRSSCLTGPQLWPS